MHEIKLTDDKPIRQRIRTIPDSCREEVKKLLDEKLRAGIIRDSKSSWCSPLNLVKKPNGKIRITVDYRKLNERTVKDAYLLSGINQLFRLLAAAVYFTKLDLTSGYYQIKMDLRSTFLTAFACEFGFYEYLNMPMGLRNAVATFQRMMDKILEGLIGVVCLVYLDNILIFSKTLKEHVINVQ